MQTKVFYESWQMDCCGTPFQIGDTVQWDCNLSNEDFIADADYYYEAHGETRFNLKGVVIEIYGVKYAYKENEDNIYYPVSHSMLPLKKAEEFMKDGENGFLVVLSDVEIKRNSL